MREVHADISQESFILLIFFLFFNISLIKKCKTLKIKMKVLEFINDINILIYDKSNKEICRTLNKIHEVCVK